MRLINADALIEALNKYKFGAISSESEREYTREVMLCFVNGSPTAYDTDRVVAELEGRLQFYESRFGEMGGTSQDVEDWGSIKSYKDAISIVKRGGVE